MKWTRYLFPFQFYLSGRIIKNDLSFWQNKNFASSEITPELAPFFLRINRPLKTLIQHQMTLKDWYLVLNVTLYSCGNVRVKRVRLLALIHMKHALQTDTTCFPNNAPVIPKVMPKWFFMAQSQNKTAAGLRRKTHTACAEQVGMCVPAQINIWLTLHSGYYLAEISEREVGGLAGFWFPSSYLFFSLYRCRNTCRYHRL